LFSVIVGFGRFGAKKFIWLKFMIDLGQIIKVSY
jgi:hypothetical protein